MALIFKVMEPREYEVTHLRASCGVRYWEDTDVDGEEDSDGSRIPCRNGDRWEPLIDLLTGRIENWKQGVTAEIHYKVCDDGEYTLLAADGAEVFKKDGYVPSILAPGGGGYGDYVVMNVDEFGFIDNWKADIREFSAFSE